jgi:hypothetical protein
MQMSKSPIISGYGSILGPVLFNIFLNDIFHFTTSSTLYIYADDNTLAHADDNIDKVVENLERQFDINRMVFGQHKS